MAKIIGHRGNRDGDVENTLTAVRNTLNGGVFSIEVDVQLSKDGEVFVFHDDLLSDKLLSLDSELEGRPISDLSLSEIKELKFKETEEKIPTLNELLDLQNEFSNKIEWNIEIKIDKTHSRFSPLEISNAVLDILNERNLNDEIIYSFDVDVLKEVRKRKQEQRINFLYESKKPDWNHCNQIVEELNADVFGPDHKLLGETGWENYFGEDRKCQLYVWTVNDPIEIKKCVEKHQVDGLITDHPLRFKS